MPIPDTFQFSQGSLQDYVDCPRRFQLRFVLMQPWPALITDDPGDYELHLQRGADFHRLVHQHSLGLDPQRLAATIDDPILAGWWQTYLSQPPAGLPDAVRQAELVLSAPLAGTEHRLVAKYDLLAIDPGQQLVIVDWKTVHKPPPRATLARRLQTRVYRYLAVEAGAALFGGQRPAPEQVEMVYWFAQAGGATERFAYNAGQYAADGAELARLVAEITACAEKTWSLTTDHRHCRFCNYRSLCDRGVTAGFLADLDRDLAPAEIEIDLEQIAEIEF